MNTKTALLVTSAAALLGVSASATPRESFSLTNGWKAVYCSSIEERPADNAWGVYPQRNGTPWWTSVDFSQAEVKPENKPDSYNGMWLESTPTIPAEWAGRRIHFDIPVPMRRADAVLFLNGKRVGDILRPGGALDITELVTPGEACTLALFLTQDGVGTERGETRVNRWDNGLARGLMYFPQLIATDTAFITDVFANPSVQKKSFTLEMEVDSATAMPATLNARILDAEGAVVKTFTESVQLQKGINLFKPTQEWADPHFWDFGDGYLYRCEVSLTADKVADVYEPFNFGFREVWRDGRDLFMNGRPLHFRTCYHYKVNTQKAMRFIQDIGYNALTYNHEMHGFPNFFLNNHIFDNADQVGIGVFASSGALLGITNDTLPDNPEQQDIYRNYVQHFHRKYRNHPSLVASYMSQMIICNIVDYPPNRIGQTIGEAQRDKVINKAREINREFNPNILYYSHADGPNGDLSSGNVYFNWTEQQEIDEWLSEFSKKAIYPWHGAEFDLPYGGCYWYGGGFAQTEFFAGMYGERAYEEEPITALDSIQERSARNRSSHGGGTRTDARTPLYWTWRKMAIQNINRYWRGYGLNGGLIWFNLGSGYGWPVNQYGQHITHGYADLDNPHLVDFTPGERPSWADPAYDIHKPVTQDFCGFLAGAPELADKTHAYYAGETIDKQAVFIWDGRVEKSFTATWKATLKGSDTVLASGTLKRTLQPGAIEHVPFSFAAPEVAQKTDYTLDVTFSDGITTSLDLEIYPRPAKAPFALPEGVRLAVCDPLGNETALLETLGIPFTAIDSIANLGDATHVLIGRNALSKINLDTSVEDLTAGRKLFVMSQTPAVLRSLGFLVQDTMSRTVFLRDATTPALASLTPDMLAYWRGSPTYAVPEYTRLMDQPTQRGPQGTFRHIVAGLILQIPEAAGFTPIIDAGYDLNFAAVLRFARGSGAITYCTLELEDRVGSDPAATEVARALLSDFVAYQPNNARTVTASGDAATAFANTLGFGTAPEGDLLLAGPDTPLAWADLRAKAEAGSTVFVYCNTALAQAAGFTATPRQFVRADLDDVPLFHGFTQALFRWRDTLKADALTQGPDSATLLANGLIADLTVGAGRVVFCQVDPFQLANRFAATPDYAAIAQDADWLKNVLARFVLKLGAPTLDDPTNGPHVSCNGRDAEAKIVVTNGLFSTSGKSNPHGRIVVVGVCPRETTWGTVKRDAEAGATVLVLDNAVIARDAGLQLGPRELLSSFDSTVLGLDPSDDSSRTFAFDRSVRRFAKAPEGFTLSADGLIAEGTVGSGRVLFLQLFPNEWIDLEQDLERIRESNDVSTDRIRQLYARLLTNLGAAPSALTAGRALHLAPDNSLKPLPAAYVLGPFITNQDNTDYMLDTVFTEEGEKMAIAGDFNPNIDFPLPQGGTANWRPTLAPDASGLYDYQKLWPGANFPTTYSIVHFNRREAGPATLRFGMDWRCKIWCNGKEVYRSTGFGAHFPKFEITLDLNKGDNVLTFKVGSGRAGNKLWALLSSEPDPDAVPRTPNPELEAVPFYQPTRIHTDPYQYLYW